MFAAGHPGSTDRRDTVAQVVFDRDVRYPLMIATATRQRKTLQEYSAASPESKRRAAHSLDGTENWLKSISGEYKALRGPELLTAKPTTRRNCVNCSLPRRASPTRGRSSRSRRQALARCQGALGSRLRVRHVVPRRGRDRRAGQRAVAAQRRAPVRVPRLQDSAHRASALRRRAVLQGPRSRARRGKMAGGRRRAGQGRPLRRARARQQNAARGREARGRGLAASTRSPCARSSSKAASRR